MKKVMMVAILLIASFALKAQSPVNFTAGFGALGTNKTSVNTTWQFYNSIGLDIVDRIGLEYGFGYSTWNGKEANDFINGRTDVLHVGSTSHLISAHYKTKKDEGFSMLFGGGVGYIEEYNVGNKEVIQGFVSPFLKVGFDGNVSKRMGIQFQAYFGDVMGVQIGVRTRL